ncbi:hypothetical protein SAMN04487820_10664 [Actinopolyspora mzabensis]|uniref:Uncharacterized protein n=1 Tax=Actinopolyspora mzabensis TaxID=995066 RepID=A0A1G9AID0_ACTMZ|nr:hypothetical protein SAMN04487820_10664 [Actinopolyspora mzabensis]
MGARHPGQVGLPVLGGARRRIPGLRGAEVTLLVGVDHCPPPEGDVAAAHNLIPRSDSTFTVAHSAITYGNNFLARRAKKARTLTRR